MATPFHSPVRVKRRRTPPKPAIALRMTSTGAPSSCATAIAAVALSALWRAGSGQRQIVDEGGAARRAITNESREARDPARKAHIHEPHIGLRIFAIGENPTI